MILAEKLQFPNLNQSILVLKGKKREVGSKALTQGSSFLMILVKKVNKHASTIVLPWNTMCIP